MIDLEQKNPDDAKQVKVDLDTKRVVEDESRRLSRVENSRVTQGDVVARAMRLFCAAQSISTSTTGTVSHTEKTAPRGCAPSQIERGTTPVKIENVQNSTSDTITPSEAIWVGKLLRLLRSGEFPNLADAITRNLDGFEFGLAAAEEAAMLRAQLERNNAVDAPDEGDRLREGVARLGRDIGATGSALERVGEASGELREKAK